MINYESSYIRQEKMQCYQGFLVNNWNCHIDCAFWDHKDYICTYENN